MVVRGAALHAASVPRHGAVSHSDDHDRHALPSAVRGDADGTATRRHAGISQPPNSGPAVSPCCGSMRTVSGCASRVSAGGNG